MILTGQGGILSISAGLGLTRFQSFRATTKPQVVTADGQKIATKAGTVAQERIEVQAKAVPKAPTIFESILAWLVR